MDPTDLPPGHRLLVLDSIGKAFQIAFHIGRPHTHRRRAYTIADVWVGPDDKYTAVLVPRRKDPKPRRRP